jgi:hypothetical protein
VQLLQNSVLRLHFPLQSLVPTALLRLRYRCPSPAARARERGPAAFHYSAFRSRWADRYRHTRHTTHTTSTTDTTHATISTPNKPAAASFAARIADRQGREGKGRGHMVSRSVALRCRLLVAAVPRTGRFRAPAPLARGRTCAAQPTPSASSHPRTPAHAARSLHRHAQPCAACGVLRVLRHRRHCAHHDYVASPVETTQPFWAGQW